MNIFIYGLTVIAIAAIDSVWLFTMGGFYKAKLAGLFASSFYFTPAVIFYLFYAFSLGFFVIAPALKNGSPLLTTFLIGMLFGLTAYAAYDLTNHATLKDWPLVVTVVDMAWGAFLSGVTSVIVVSIYKLFR